MFKSRVALPPLSLSLPPHHVVHAHGTRHRPFEPLPPSNVPLRATLCGISSREEGRMGSGDKESERCQHRPPAWKNLRRDCCTPRAQRVPGALSLVRGHRKSPEDDELTEDPGATRGSSCRRERARNAPRLDRLRSLSSTTPLEGE